MALLQTKSKEIKIELSPKEVKQMNTNIKRIYEEIKLTKEYKQNVLNCKNMDLTRQAKLVNRIDYKLNDMYSMLVFYEQQLNAIEGNTSAETYMDKGLNKDIIEGVTLATYGLD